MLEAFAAGKNFLVELIHYKKDGTTFWGRSKGQAVYNEPGSLIQYFAIIEDISQEKEQEEQLRILSLIAEENLNSVMIADADGRITWVNKGFTKMTGFLLEEVIGKRPGHFLQGPETDPKTVQYLSAQIKAGAPFLCEILNYNKSGQPYWLRIQGQAIRNKKGVVTGFFALEEDISNERAINDALRFKEEKYRNILANMHLGIVEVDLEEKILYVNQRFCEISGYDEIELIGQNARTLFMTRENGRIMQEKLSLRKKGKADAYEIMVKNKSGETRWWLISGAPRYDDKGELVGSIGIHLDITEQKTLQDELLEARELAEASSKAKEIFLANMSHEIRTPMHAISGMAELLSKTKLIERQRFYLGVIQSASENMLVILNDILDMSKLEANKLTLEQIGFDIKLVLEKAIAVMQHRAEEKSLVLRLEKIDAGISTILIGDPFRLNQILFNLISNAIKFTERGQILLECQLQEQNENRQTLVLKVTDTGIGMDQEFLEQLFDKFTQEHQSTSRNFGGTGLGMNITKELVELMDGQIEVESQKGKGSVFTLSIPFKIGQHMDLPDLKKEVINPDIFKGLKILLVDDNDMNRLVANTMLENLGAKCVEAVNGKEAVEYMETNHADLILMDIQMPVMDGLQATGIIKKMKHSPPIIALTANALKSDNEKYLKAGMVDSLPKPFSEDEFINLISRVITKSRGQKVANTLSIQISEIPLFDLRNLVKISNGNQSLIRKMLLLFLEQTPGMLQQMEKALKEKNLQAISELAHKMKPSLDNLGIISLKEVVRKLEKAKDENLGLEEVKALQINLTYTLNLAFEKLQIEMEKT
jgi:PAS domain S-box-containing protein